MEAGQGLLYNGREWNEWIDLQEDPNELNNLIDNPKYRNRVEQFRKDLSETRTAIGVTEY